MRVIGIDPGLSGAIAVLDGKKVLGLFDMPVMSEGKKNKRQLNSAQLVNIIKEFMNKETAKSRLSVSMEGQLYDFGSCILCWGNENDD